MKLTTIALATAFALSGTATFANTVHHKTAARADRNAVGMVQLPPVMISAPFKILLFVLVDGWNLVIGSLMKSFYS